MLSKFSIEEILKFGIECLIQERCKEFKPMIVPEEAREAWRREYYRHVFVGKET